SDTVSFVVYPAAVATITTRPVPAQCLTGTTASFTLGATCANGTPAWTFYCRPAGSSPRFTDPGSCSTTAVVDAPGVYCARLTVTLSLHGARPIESDTVSFVVYPAAVATITTRPVP